MEISFLVGVKNNIEYTQQFYQHTRRLYPQNEIVFVSYGSTDDTHQWLENLNDENVKYFFSEESKTLSDTYNKATEIATKPYVVFLHNDMVLGQFFLENLQKNISEKDISYYSVVEPPIFGDDARDWKNIVDFGSDFQTFRTDSFLSFEKKLAQKNDSVIPTKHTSFFLCINRKTLLEIGGLDPLFNPMFCEDDDLIFRLQLLELETFLIKNAIVYHFVSKTSRFSEEYKNTTRAIEEKSQRNFVRKWGFLNHSKSRAKYDIGIVLKNANSETVAQVEPFATTLYTDADYQDYIKKEQVNTLFSLRERIKPISEIKKHAVLVEINAKQLNSKTLNILRNLADIITHRIENKQFGESFWKKIGYKFLKPYIPIIEIKNGVERLEKKLIKKDLC